MALRRSMLSAAVFVLAAVGGVLGNQLTRDPGHGFAWDGFAVGFLVVTVIGAVGVVLLDRWSGSTATPGTAGGGTRGPLIGNATVAGDMYAAESMTFDQRRTQAAPSTDSPLTGGDEAEMGHAT